MSLPPSRYPPSQRTDPILGPVKVCTGCGEEWPLDPEFYYVHKVRPGTYVRAGRTYIRSRSWDRFYAKCRACWSDRNQREQARRAS